MNYSNMTIRPVKFEVGNVYLLVPSTLLLAVADDLLIGWGKGVPVEHRPSSKKGLEVQRGLSIGELCNSWGVELCVIDAITHLYVQPARARNASPKQKRRGAKRGSVDEEQEQQRIRLLHKFLKG